MGRQKRKRKGYFSDLRLSVAKRYVHLAPRNSLLLIGGVGVVIVGALVAFDVVRHGGVATANGPLSANHAMLNSECSSCHSTPGSVSDDKCAVCHEKFGDDLGVYSFASHYLYRSQDFTRVVALPDEVSCFACHREHRGRDASLLQVPDTQCTSCHEFGSFDDGHPEFEFAADRIPDPAGLHFTHTRHVNEVRKRKELADIEEACLYCHRAGEDGRNFRPISFEDACSACHIASGTTTEWLPVADGRNVSEAGVLTLETIRASGAPGTRWSEFMNPDEFQRRGNEVRKREIYHEDPWILDNLHRVRSILYPSSELADLLRASGDVDPDRARELYREAIQTLQGYTEELEAVPDRNVQRELAGIRELIARVQARLRDPLAPLDETQFMVPVRSTNPELGPTAVAAYDSLVATLAAPCRTCHEVEGAAIARVQTDQRVLRRADFNHRAHITQRGCLDCHKGIPIREFAARDSVATPDLDRAGIQNIPTIETCRGCHSPTKASSTCVTCHPFHANKSQHENLLRYLK